MHGASNWLSVEALLVRCHPPRAGSDSQESDADFTTALRPIVGFLTLHMVETADILAFSEVWTCQTT
jgi:hypothetical protein